MNAGERYLISYVCAKDYRRARVQAKSILEHISTAKDASFRDYQLKKLAKDESLEVPDQLKGLITLEDSSKFNSDLFLARKDDTDAVDRLMKCLRASEALSDLGIAYAPTLLLYGVSGTGKTTLARYAAYLIGLPFIRVRFTGLVESYLGKTQKNVQKVFDFAQERPCVLCFDELDAVGLQRGQADDVGEMNRVTIAIMQEMDDIPNGMVVIGTTNRRDIIDPALARRFSFDHEVKALTLDDVCMFTMKFLTHVGLPEAYAANIVAPYADGSPTASSVIGACTEFAVSHIDECRRVDAR
jgi:hypothetical protein